jgi:hypothetical protein
MPPEHTIIAPGSEPEQANPVPELKAEVAHPDAESDPAEPKEPDEVEPKQLTDAERTQQRMQKRIDRQNAKLSEALRENAQLRARSVQAEPGEDDDSPDIEQIASQRAHEIVHSQTLNQKAEAVLKAGRKIDGFETAVAALREEVSFVDGKGKVTPFLEAILDSDAPAQVLSYLGNNPDEAAEYEGLTPAQIGRRLAKLEDKLKQESTVKTSKAPAPITPIKGNGVSVSPEFSKMTFSDYEKARAKQGAAWSRLR